MSDLPEFEKRPKPLVNNLAMEALMGHLVALQSYDDGHFRAIFRRAYFHLEDAQAEPSKSQWGTLKKRFKRRDHTIFIFKAHGTCPCPKDKDSLCYYLDFGFLAD